MGAMERADLLGEHSAKLMTPREASVWATAFLKKEVTSSNVAYLVRYGRIQNYGEGSSVLVSQLELRDYYRDYYGRERSWKKALGEDLNWTLSFAECKESETTKHVHRLHPYKGKFIPQLVRYFIDSHTDKFKREVFFEAGDIILDPFCGSGTTLVECSEMGMHGIGVDVSQFNTMISNAKISEYDLAELNNATDGITHALRHFNSKARVHEFEQKLLEELYEFNKRHFLTREKIISIHRNGDGDTYGHQKAEEFLPKFTSLAEGFSIPLFDSAGHTAFMERWYHPHILKELNLINGLIRKSDKSLADILSIILCRTARSSRATTHADLATLKDPVSHTYYCRKHGKICKPLFSSQKWWETYCQDTIKRLGQYQGLRKDSLQHCLWNDSIKVNLEEALKKEKSELVKIYRKHGGIKGIFSSPPYVGLIDYHEQHAYAYELLDLKRADKRELGPASKGQSKAARDDYVEGISAVLSNCKRFLVPDYHVFLVANDKFGLYPKIAERAGMEIVNQYKRPVLNRTEKDRTAYSEFIFHLREK